MHYNSVSKRKFIVYPVGDFGIFASVIPSNERKLKVDKGLESVSSGASSDFVCYKEFLEV